MIAMTLGHLTIAYIQNWENDLNYAYVYEQSIIITFIVHRQLLYLGYKKIYPLLYSVGEINNH